MSQVLLNIETTRSHSHTNTSIGLSGRVISPKQRPLPDNRQHSQERDSHTLGGIRTRIPNKRAAADLCLRQRGHWDRQPGTLRYLLFTDTYLPIYIII